MKYDISKYMFLTPQSRYSPSLWLAEATILKVPISELNGCFEPRLLRTSFADTSDRSQRAPIGTCSFIPN
jgi:hypothetical protein